MIDTVVLKNEYYTESMFRSKEIYKDPISDCLYILHKDVVNSKGAVSVFSVDRTGKMTFMAKYNFGTSFVNGIVIKRFGDFLCVSSDTAYAVFKVAANGLLTLGHEATDMGGNTRDFAYDGTFLYASHYWEGISTYTMSATGALTRVKNYDVATWTYSALEMVEGYLMAAVNSYLTVFSVSGTGQIAVRYSYSLSGTAERIQYIGNVAYVFHSNGLRTFTINGSTGQATAKQVYVIAHGWRGAVASEKYVYFTDLNFDGVKVYSITDPATGAITSTGTEMSRLGRFNAINPDNKSELIYLGQYSQSYGQFYTIGHGIAELASIRSDNKTSMNITQNGTGSALKLNINI